MKKEINKLTKYKIKINKLLLTYPEGRLGIRKERGIVRYYHILGSKSSAIEEIYISKNNIQLAKTLAQKDYYIKTLKYIDRRLNNIDKIKKLSELNDIMQVYNNLSPVRKQLVIPIESTWEDRVNKWFQIPYEKMPIKYNTPEIYTKNGELVKSKTEKIMADFFFDNAIKYKYEKPLYLDNFGTVYPDFTFLSPYNFNEIYWEHFGMIDNPEYAQKMVRKINAYQKNGYIIGKNLIITFEASNEVLNLDIVKNLVNEYLI